MLEREWTFSSILQLSLLIWEIFFQMTNSVNFKGQVLHARSSSKRVYWLHVEVTECSCAMKKEEIISIHSRVEIISKGDESSDVLDYIRYSVKVGDVIELECWKEDVPKGKL